MRCCILLCAVNHGAPTNVRIRSPHPVPVMLRFVTAARSRCWRRRGVTLYQRRISQTQTNPQVELLHAILVSQLEFA